MTTTKTALDIVNRSYNAQTDADRLRIDILNHLEATYVPTLSDAQKWAKTTDQFIFVEDLLDLSLFSDGEAYVSQSVDRVERAFERLLSEV